MSWRSPKGSAADRRWWSTAPINCATAPRSPCRAPRRRAAAAARTRGAMARVVAVRAMAIPVAAAAAAATAVPAAAAASITGMGKTAATVPARRRALRHRLPEERALRHESVAPLHSQTCRHLAVDGGDPDRGCDRLFFPASVGVAGGGLPDHPGPDLSARCQPGGHDLDRDRPARTPVRPDARSEGNVFAQFRRRLRAHAAIRPEPE